MITYLEPSVNNLVEIIWTSLFVCSELVRSLIDTLCLFIRTGTLSVLRCIVLWYFLCHCMLPFLQCRRTGTLCILACVCLCHRRHHSANDYVQTKLNKQYGMVWYGVTSIVHTTRLDLRLSRIR